MSRLPLLQYSRSSQMSRSEQSAPHGLPQSTSDAQQPPKKAFDDVLYAQFYDALFSGIIQNTEPPTPPPQPAATSPTYSTKQLSSSSSSNNPKYASNTSSGTAVATTAPAASLQATTTPLPQKKVDQLLGAYELGLDVNFYASKLNAFIGQAITRNIYVLDVSTGTGRVLADILTLLSSSRIKQRLHFVGTDCHEAMLSRARLKIHKLLRTGAASGVDSISVNFVDADFESIERSVSPRRFHLIIVALACFHRITTKHARLDFLTSVSNLLLPDGRCIINLLPDKDILISKHQVNILLDESLGSDPASSTPMESQRLMHTRSNVSRYRTSWRHEIGRPLELTYFHLNYTDIEIEDCTDEELEESELETAEKIMNATFNLQVTKETESPPGTCNGRHLKSVCSMKLRTVNVQRLFDLIIKADLEVIETYDTFRTALCRQKSVGTDSAKVIVIGRMQQPNTMRKMRTIQ